MFLLILIFRVIGERLNALTLCTPVVILYAIFKFLINYRIRIPRNFIPLFFISFLIIFIGIISAYKTCNTGIVYSLKSIIRYPTYFLILLLAFNSRITIKQFIYVLIVILFISYIAFYYQLFFEGLPRPPGLFIHSNAYAYFLVFANIVLFTNNVFKTSFIRDPILISIALTLLLTKSMGGTIAYTFSFLYILQNSNSKAKKLKQVIFLLVLAAGGIMFLSSRIRSVTESKIDLAEKIANQDTHAGNSLNWRIVYWFIIINKTITNKNAMFGNGIESVSLASPYFLDGLTHDPHNDYVRVFAETGIVGLLLYIILLLRISRSLRKRNSELKKIGSPVLKGVICIFYTIIIAQFPGNIIGSSVLMWCIWFFSGIMLRECDYIIFSICKTNSRYT